MAKKAVESTPNYVLVTTSHRGVFFGIVDKYDGGEVIDLTNARNVLYWGRSVKGFLGLASGGPDNTCRIGPAVAKLHLLAVDSVSEVTAEAVAKFEAAPWSNS